MCRACFVPNPLVSLLGTTQLKNHMFFEEIDWMRLSQRHVIPPFLPKVKGKTRKPKPRRIESMSYNNSGNDEMGQHVHVTPWTPV